MAEKIRELLKMDLQTFSEGEEGNEGGENSGENSEGSNSGEEGSTEKVELTEEELQKKIEAESDRKLQSALKKKESEWQKQMDLKIQEAVNEKERLSKLSEKERKEEELTQKEKELQERLQELERREMVADAVQILKDKDMPVSLAESLLSEDAEKTLENINDVEKTIKDWVNEQVKVALRQDTPPAGSNAGGSSKVQSFAEMRNKQAQGIENAPNPWSN